MKLAPRFCKVLRDIGETPFRTALAVVAMAAGTFGLGTILTAYSILGRELAATYEGTRPSSATLGLDRVDNAAVEATRGLAGVGEAEARPVIRGRVRVGPDDWTPLVLFVVGDFEAQRLDRFERDAGASAPGPDEVLLERACLSVARAQVGERITVKTADGVERSLGVAGTVHAAGLAPGWMDHVVSGFVSTSSLARAEARAESAELRIRVAENRLDEAHIRAVAQDVKVSLEGQGRTVRSIDVPAPGRHPHAGQMDTFLFLLGAFGALTLALGAVLVANMIHALLTEQIRQVGIMKAVGASTGQIAGLYLGQVLILAAIALSVGLPLALWAGLGYARFAAAILNANIVNGTPAAWVIAVLIAVGLALPLLVALGPVHRVSRITIHEALSNDVGRRRFGTRAFDRWLARLRFVPRPFRLSLRTTFHRRGRLALTVGTLAVAGAVFMSALNVAAAWRRVVAADYDTKRYDIDVRLDDLYPVARVADAVAGATDMARVEYWSDASAVLIGPGGVPGARVILVGPPKDSKLLELPLLFGRWLTPGDDAAVVINQGLGGVDPTQHVGGRITLRVNGTTVFWPVVGLVNEVFGSHLGGPPTLYAPQRAVIAASGQASDVTRSLRVVSRGHDVAGQLAASRQIERGLARAGVGVRQILRRREVRQAFADHLVIVISALVFATGLVVLVGGLGLTSTLSLNVLERTREMGVLSAIGATPRTIAGFVVTEGVLIGVLSFVLSLLAAVPITFVVDGLAGRIFIKTALGFYMSPAAAAAWLALVIILAAVSSYWPARQASRRNVREALAYE